jgi:hypothetical protein
MAYSKQTWSNSPSTATPLSAARLNHMEDGIGAAQLTDNMIQQILNDPAKYCSAAVIYSLAQTVQTLNDNLAYIDIASFITINSDYCAGVQAYVENGQVVISCAIKAVVTGSFNPFTINNTKYRPRLIVNGQFAFSSTINDTYAKVQAVTINYAGQGNVWLSSGFNSVETVTFTYPVRLS